MKSVLASALFHCLVIIQMITTFKLVKMAALNLGLQHGVELNHEDTSIEAKSSPFLYKISGGFSWTSTAEPVVFWFFDLT